MLEVYDHGADLVTLRDLSGAITEGPGYNVFALVDGRWLTPASGTLAGVTRRTVIELACQDGQPSALGTPGPLTGRLRDLNWASHADPRYATPVRYGQSDRPATA